MNKEVELSNSLYEAIKRVTRGAAVIEATVEAVDEVSFTCDVSVKNSETETATTFFEVPLRVLISNQASVVEIPEIGTKCIICFRDSNIGRPQILMIHKALKILVICDQIIFNNGTLGGMVKVGDLVSKLNALEGDINTLKTAFSSWAPISGDGGAALKTAASGWFGNQLPVTQASQIENPKIKQ